jgi:hypothetical protein
MLQNDIATCHIIEDNIGIKPDFSRIITARTAVSDIAVSSYLAST